PRRICTPFDSIGFQARVKPEFVANINVFRDSTDALVLPSDRRFSLENRSWLLPLSDYSPPRPRLILRGRRHRRCPLRLSIFARPLTRHRMPRETCWD